jgi:hypothetical protein
MPASHDLHPVRRLLASAIEDRTSIDYRQR